MPLEKPQQNEKKLPIDKFLDKRPNFGKYTGGKDIEKDNSGSISVEEFKEYKKSTHEGEKE